MVRMMFSDMSQKFGGGALLPDDDEPAVDALGRGAADLVEMFPGSAGIMSLRHLEISTDVYLLVTTLHLTTLNITDYYGKNRYNITISVRPQCTYDYSSWQET